MPLDRTFRRTHTKLACVTCRHLKKRCVNVAGEGCERCQARGRACVYTATASGSSASLSMQNGLFMGFDTAKFLEDIEPIQNNFSHFKLTAPEGVPMNISPFLDDYTDTNPQTHPTALQPEGMSHAIPPAQPLHDDFSGRSWYFTCLLCLDGSHGHIHSTDNASTDVIASLKVYKNIASLLSNRAFIFCSPLDGEASHLNDLQMQIYRMAHFDAVCSLVNSYQFHAQLMATALTLKCQDDPDFRKAVNDDDNDLILLWRSTLNSEVDKNLILQLTGNDAERFLTLTYLILDKHRSLFDNNEETSQAHRLVVKLSQSCGILPACLQITGISDCSKEAVSGGGLADIFQATYQGTRVALKRLRDFQVHQQRQKQHRKFCQEAILWRDLKHPNVLPFYGVDFETFLPRVCMVSPWMPNGTLMEHIEALGGALSTDVSRYLLEIAEGLGYLHSKNIIHGDLKGHNIFIDEDWHPRLADFGLAAWADATLATSTSNHAGSVRWMAPELHTSEVFRRTKCSDVYAFACVSVETYTGKYPFYDIARDVTVILKVTQGERPKRPTTDTGRTMPDELWDLVEMCWKQDPSERPHMVDIVDRLGRVLAAF